jgi:hypothetical protein
VGITGFLTVIYLCFVGSGTGSQFSSFRSESYIKLFFCGECFPLLLFLPIAPLGTVQLCSCRLVGGFNHLFSFH